MKKTIIIIIILSISIILLYYYKNNINNNDLKTGYGKEIPTSVLGESKSPGTTNISNAGPSPIKFKNN